MNKPVYKTPTFYDIERALYKSQYKEAMGFLEEMPFSSKNSYYYYLLEGITFFNLVRLDRAYKSFRNALEYKENDTLVKLYLACVHLKNMKTDFALKQWLEILEFDEQNSYAKRAIAILKRSKETELPHLTQNMYRYRLLPPFVPTEIKRKRLRNIILAVVFLALIGASIPFLPRLYTIVQARMFPRNERSLLIAEGAGDAETAETLAHNDEIREYTIQDIAQFPVREEFSPGKVRGMVRDIEKKFVKYRENEVRVLINTLLYSNTDEEQKRHLAFLLNNLALPTFLSDLQWFDFDEVQGEPWKYHNVAVKWRGTVTQILRMQVSEEAALQWLSPQFSQYEEILRARFLVDFYGNNKILSAILPLYFSPDLKLQNGDEVELLALLKFNEPVLNRLASLAADETDTLLLAQSFRYILE